MCYLSMYLIYKLIHIKRNAIICNNVGYYAILNKQLQIENTRWSSSCIYKYMGSKIYFIKWNDDFHGSRNRENEILVKMYQLSIPYNSVILSLDT